MQKGRLSVQTARESRESLPSSFVTGKIPAVSAADFLARSLLRTIGITQEGGPKMEKWNALEEGTKAEIGKVVYPDGWSGHGAPLEESDWRRADFRLQGYRSGIKLAVTIAVTGRTFQSPWGTEGARAVRVRIEFVGDGEPSTFSGGWMIL